MDQTQAADQGVSPNYLLRGAGAAGIARMNDVRDVRPTSPPPPTPNGPIGSGLNELLCRLRAGHSALTELEHVLFPILASPGQQEVNAKVPDEPHHLIDRIDRQIRLADALVGRIVDLAQRVQL